jgi:hypothetical protein
MGWVPKPTAEWDSNPKDDHEPKGKKAVTSRLGMGIGLGPEVGKVKWKPKKLKHAGEGPPAEIGRGCFGHFQAHSSLAGSNSSPQNKARGSEEIHVAYSEGPATQLQTHRRRRGCRGSLGHLPATWEGRRWRFALGALQRPRLRRWGTHVYPAAVPRRCRQG